MNGHGVTYILHHVATIVEQHFFSQRVLNVWNAQPDSVDFASLNKFKQSILHIDFSDHLVCFKCRLLVILCASSVRIHVCYFGLP